MRDDTVYLRHILESIRRIDNASCIIGILTICLKTRFYKKCLTKECTEFILYI